MLNAVRDATSAANPYAALVVPPLARAAGVAHTTPRLVYVRPDEAGLGESSARFRGQLALLEARAGGQKADVLNTAEMLARCAAAPTATADGPAFLRARLLDVWLGDWDRHEKQWNWAARPAPGAAPASSPCPRTATRCFFGSTTGPCPGP
ncbi:hypothetical protein BEN49_23525 [Hymenobacter coccineus]|uniref:Uncharacterized protein n=1 Tax=Hymenobacter coccineus TaxID=1908235 RepID=A0A1G1TH60_9BACT|nr:hypothetical protein BEN49_23525 [Hymenobacter coccineus]